MMPGSRAVAIIQARMGSSRLPGKVLLDLGGATTLARVVNRTCKSRQLQEVLIATSKQSADEAIVAECSRLGIHCFRGSEDDVLDRYMRAAREARTEIVVRITADCPLIDPELIDDLIQAFFAKPCDYASNALDPHYPRGLGAEVFTLKALEQAWSEAKQPYQRVHVTPYFYENPQLFSLMSLVGPRDYTQYRWTLDTTEDLEFIRLVYARLGNRDDFSWRQVLALVEAEPELSLINSLVRQKSLQEC